MRLYTKRFKQTKRRSSHRRGAASDDGSRSPVREEVNESYGGKPGQEQHDHLSSQTAAASGPDSPAATTSVSQDWRHCALANKQVLTLKLNSSPSGALESSSGAHSGVSGPQEPPSPASSSSGIDEDSPSSPHHTGGSQGEQGSGGMLADWFNKLFVGASHKDGEGKPSPVDGQTPQTMRDSDNGGISPAGVHLDEGAAQGSASGGVTPTEQHQKGEHKAPAEASAAGQATTAGAGAADGGAQGEHRGAGEWAGVAGEEAGAGDAAGMSNSRSAPNLRSPQFLGLFGMRSGPPPEDGGSTNSSPGGEKGGHVHQSSLDPSATALQDDSDGEEVDNFMPHQAQDAPKPGIEDFTMLRVLGKGSYGKVVLVRKKNTGVLYAMKMLKKGDVVRKRQIERTKIERRVLGHIDHPFLMKLHFAFQTDNKLYLVLDYCPGGELFFHLSRYKRFPEGVVRFYTAELVLALKHLHESGIIYRDIKPENILLDGEGHLKLGDFGLAKDNVTSATVGAQSVCGTPEYMAPEVINKSGHGTAVDWWGLGMLMYEMLTGLPPWYTKDRQKLFERLRGAPLVIPKGVTPASASIIQGLLTRNPSKRLGALGASQVMSHEFFRGLQWDALYEKRIPAPLNPCRAQGPDSDSTHNFDPQFTRLPLDTVSAAGAMISPTPNMNFDGFTYEQTGVMEEASRR